MILNVSPPQICEEPIDTIFENFDLDAPQVSPVVRRSNRKSKFTDPSPWASFQKENAKQFFFSAEKNLLEGRVLWDRYLPIDELFQILH